LVINLFFFLKIVTILLLMGDRVEGLLCTDPLMSMRGQVEVLECADPVGRTSKMYDLTVKRGSPDLGDMFSTKQFEPNCVSRNLVIYSKFNFYPLKVLRNVKNKLY
jgi:hypothetical protein